MTLKELYTLIGGDYDSAMKVLRIEKLMDKHIRRLPSNSVFADLTEAGKTMDPTGLFESSHAIKGVCANLGLVNIAHAASEICDEFRDGAARRLSDDEVKKRIEYIDEAFKTASRVIGEYDASVQ